MVQHVIDVCACLVHGIQIENVSFAEVNLVEHVGQILAPAVSKLSIPRTCSPRSNRARTSETNKASRAGYKILRHMPSMNNGWIARQTREAGDRVTIVPEPSQFPEKTPTFSTNGKGTSLLVPLSR